MSARSRSNWNLEVLVFEERGKPEYPEKNLSEQGREPTTNSTHIWRRRQDSNPGHIGGRRVLSPLRHPSSPSAPVISTKRTCSYLERNDHRLDERFFYRFWDVPSASEKNNFIGRVNLSLTMKTMFLRHSQKSINSKLKFKGSEWKPSRGFWILLSLQFVSILGFHSREKAEIKMEIS